MIMMEDVYFAYDGLYTALQGTSLQIDDAERIAIMGTNGAGKTTLVKHLNGLLRPNHGRVVFDGVDTKHYSVAELAREIGLVMQNPDHQLFLDSVSKEVEFGNVRAEMWWTVAQLFADGLVSIPNDDILINDLCAPKYEIDSRGKIKIESKQEIKKRLGRSPDRGDACVMGFYAQKFAQTKKHFLRTRQKNRGVTGRGIV